jgi:hypothetical protein
MHFKIILRSEWELNTFEILVECHGQTIGPFVTQNIQEALKFYSWLPQLLKGIDSAITPEIQDLRNLMNGNIEMMKGIEQILIDDLITTTDHELQVKLVINRLKEILAASKKRWNENKERRKDDDQSD